MRALFPPKNVLFVYTVYANQPVLMFLLFQIDWSTVTIWKNATYCWKLINANIIRSCWHASDWHDSVSNYDIQRLIYCVCLLERRLLQLLSTKDKNQTLVSLRFITETRCTKYFILVSCFLFCEWWIECGCVLLKDLLWKRTVGHLIDFVMKRKLKKNPARSVPVCLDLSFFET